MTYQKMLLYLCHYKTKSLRSTRVSPTTPNMYILKWFRFIIAKIYNILRYVIPRILRHMCNLHIKETEISQKRSKRIKNWKITYSVILSVLSNKTNLILGFSFFNMIICVAFVYFGDVNIKREIFNALPSFSCKVFTTA